MLSKNYDRFNVFCIIMADGIEYELGEIDDLKLTLDFEMDTVCYFSFYRSWVYGMMHNLNIEKVTLVFLSKETNNTFNWFITPTVCEYIGYDDERVYMKIEFNMVKDLET